MISDPDLVYLSGHSLGRMPEATRDRLRHAMEVEWGERLLGGWDQWISLARRAGDVLATGVLGVAPGEVVLSDSTSVNLYKLAIAALDARPGRRVIVTDDDNFSSDRYVLHGLAAARGATVRMVAADMNEGISLHSVQEALGDDVALVALSHMAYRSGAVADLVGITAAAHRAGAMMLWDLSHSAGATPTPLRQAGADLAVGATYKYLNGGPGAPAFLFVRADLQTELRQPIWGWFGQRDQFAMGPDYDPVDSVDRFLVGTPPVLAYYGVLEGARLAAEAGVDAIAAKATALTSYAVELVDDLLAPHGFALASPRDPARRGAHVTLHHPYAWQVYQAWKAARVVPDFRTPDRIRVGLAPLYTRFTDVYEAVHRLRQIMGSGEYLRFGEERSRVT
ncbi:MAG TPA: aminotransferase class V-fold PLP-dependent enzyme [Micromonosporaceae bacterium]|nr:aminotransferase class V-fold PLP-dependent enzyme [Micromonosporaceae bacterium]